MEVLSRGGVISGEDRGENGGDEGTQYVGSLVANTGEAGSVQAVPYGSEERCYRDEECGLWGFEQPEGEGERGREAGRREACDGAWKRDGPVGAWLDLAKGGDHTRRAA